MMIETPNNTNIKRTEATLQALCYMVIAAGIILRLAKYLSDWSLRGDEFSVVLNLLDRSMASLLTSPMDHEQAAPIGFLAIEKLFLHLFGSSEYSLRFIPISTGIASIFLYYKFLAKTLNKYGSLFALTAFSFGNYLIYYASEIKQYSTDVFITILLSLAFLAHVNKKDLQNRDFILLGIGGVAALLFSHPALFVLIGMGFTLIIHHIRNKTNLIKTLIMGIAWAGTFGLLYLLLLRKQVTSEYLIIFWGNLLSYMPMPPWRDISWFFKALEGLYFVVGEISGGLIIVLSLSILGAWGFIKKQQWQWVVFIVFVAGLNMVVSGFQKYPFHGRLILYLLPLVFLVLGKGVEALTKLHTSRAYAAFILIVCSIIILQPAVSTTTSYLFDKSYVTNDLKSVLGFMQNNIQDDDIVYLYHRADTMFTYYAPQYQLQNLNLFHGEKIEKKVSDYNREVNRLPHGKRIWVVFNTTRPITIDKNTKQEERDYILNLFNQSGTLITEFYGANDASSVHLYILK